MNIYPSFTNVRSNTDVSVFQLANARLARSIPGKTDWQKFETNGIP